LVDYHIHTIFSCDSELKAGFVCSRAIEMGFSEIAFTEHLDLDPIDEGYGLYDYNALSEEIEKLRRVYNGQLKIKKGVEVTYQKEREEEIKEFLSNKDYDFVIGSVHLVGDFDVSQKKGTKEFCEAYARKKVYDSYFEVTKSLAGSGIFDCLGHFEMIRRYATMYIDDYSPDEFKEQIDEILSSVAENDLALEVNTSGMRHFPNETYPRMQLCKRFLELGGKSVTIGSDAHLPEHIGYRISETMKLLLSIGLTEIALFSERKKRYRRLENIMQNRKKDK